MTLQGKTALVTGGGRGIGRAICLRLAKMGAKVYINYVAGADTAEAVQREIADFGGQARVLPFNVADAVAVAEAVKTLIAEAGAIDILVNNAGITRDGLLARMKEEDWDAVVDTNLKGAFLCAKAVSKQMMKQRFGRIINIASVIGCTGNAGQVNYAAAKAGLIGLTKSLARELASRTITVNAVAPGYIVTEMTAALSEEARAQLLSEIPMAVLGSAQDVAGAVAYLAGPDGGYISGQTIHVNGGMYM
ncbi:MAG: 3-oxoacyl-[acyl-carrier-protein] reductase [Desulfobulbaceae bacterium]|jgi:3-oxoacyl-[acyl-carrier protein] reductase|nr:3-oxoacyl-[acyl-carrier-protein] reductase [Desulfobulbaceae bacterium]